MEVGDGTDGKPRSDGGSHASGHGDLTGNPADPWSANASGRTCRIPLPWQPLGLGIRYIMDLGAIGSSGRITGTSGGTRRPRLGCRRFHGPAEPELPVVVIWELRASFGHCSNP